MRYSALPITILLLLPALPGQTPPVGVYKAPPTTGNPGVDSPLVYQSFFRRHDDMNKRAEKLLPANPAEGSKALAALANLYRVSPQEHARLAAISRSVSTALDKTDEVARSYVEGQKRRNQPLDGKELRQFSLARLKALGDGIRRLGEELSPASWNGLRAQINEDHRTRIFRAESQNGNAASMTSLPVRR